MPRISIGFFALALSAAGLPIYIHLPRYADVDLGLSLATVGSILIAIRILDFAQDPLLGRLVDRFPERRPLFAFAAVVALAAGFLALFSLEPVFSPVLWLVAVLILIFTAYSLAMILFYGQTRALSEGSDASAMIHVAKWRETGSLFGIILAASLPIWLGYPVFGFVLFSVIVLAGIVSRPIWSLPSQSEERLRFSDLRKSGAGSLILLTFVNSLPVAITSTLFLFFVEDRLRLADASGLLLILFFLAAAASIPVWTRLSGALGPRLALIVAMTLAIASFGWASQLTEGALLAFSLICIGSGFALGADMLLLPALFSAALARNGLQTGQAFGLWSFSNKVTLAIAAAVVLPILELSGFQAAQENSQEALSRLTLLYAVIPCGLKCLAAIYVVSLPKKVFSS